MIRTVKVYENFITKEECDKILIFAKEFFEIDKRSRYGWHARTNRDLHFENQIKEKLNKISPLDLFYVSWINLSEYEDGRSLDLHTDQRSDFTFTIPLTDGYDGGKFLIEDEKYVLSKGDCISFDGYNLRHGVEPVIKGYRASLNVWIRGGNKPML